MDPNPTHPFCGTAYKIIQQRTSPFSRVCPICQVIKVIGQLTIDYTTDRIEEGVEVRYNTCYCGHVDLAHLLNNVIRIVFHINWFH